jgi:4-amino-4-deoxy-L-arabinose transferase-like glycosyltransferase
MSDSNPSPTLPTPSPLPSPKRAWVLLAAIASFTMLWGLWDGPLIKTEGHRAITAHQMVDGGDWVVPHLFGRVYRRKPPLHYWVLACSEKLFGANEWAWRLPSALAAVGLCLMLWAFTRRWFGELGGLVAGFACCSTVWLWSQSRNADIDSLNTLAAVAACCCAIQIGFGTGRRWPFAVASGVACVAMMMLKGPAGLMAYGGTLLGAAVANRTVRWWAHPGIWAPPIAGVAAFLAWKSVVTQRLAEVGVSAPDTAITELIDRITPTTDTLSNMAVAVGGLILMTLPVSWTILVPAIRKPTLEQTNSKIYRALLGAVLSSLVLCAVFLIARPRYGFIVLPLLCPLAGAAAETWRRGGLTDRGVEFMWQTLTMIGIVLIGVTVWAPVDEYRMIEQVNGPLIGLTILSLTVGGYLIYLIRSRQIARGSWCVALMLIPLASMSYARAKSVERHVQSGKRPGQIMRAHQDQFASDSVVWSGEMARNHPDVLHYGRFDVRRPPATRTRPDAPTQDAQGRPAFDLDPVFESGQPGWFVLTDHEWKKYQTMYADRLSHALIVTEAYHELDQPVIVYFEGSSR